jgi:hypothetical protein
MIIIYSNKITPRLEYVCDFIFNEFFGLQYKLSGNPSGADSGNVPILNYSAEKIISSLKILPSGLLEETGLKKKQIKVKRKKEIPLIFPNEEEGLGFDVFSAVFFMLSRYEEYLGFPADEHGRFPAGESFAFQNNFLHQSVVEHWLNLLEDELKEKFPDLKVKSRKFNCLSTIDIDNAFAYKGKSFARFGGAMARSAVKGNFSDFRLRLKFIRGASPDPFDHYDFQLDLAEKNKIPLLYFVLCASRGEYDVSLEPSNPEFSTLIKKIASKAGLGIHPSYASNSNKEKVRNEIDDLVFLSGKKITRSRQHFLKFRFPDTPRLLIDYGIADDYSMGFSTENGFRAGTSQPFYFYDLLKEQKTSLRMHPFQVMDSVFFDQKKLSAEEAWPAIENILNEVESVKGNFISVWHDRSFDNNLFPGWKENYAKLQQLCAR